MTYGFPTFALCAVLGAWAHRQSHEQTTRVVHRRARNVALAEVDGTTPAPDDQNVMPNIPSAKKKGEKHEFGQIAFGPEMAPMGVWRKDFNVPLTYTFVGEGKFEYVATFWLAHPDQRSSQTTMAETVDSENAFLSNWFPSAWDYRMKLDSACKTGCKTLTQHVKTAMAAVLLEKANLVSPDAVKSCQNQIDKWNADYDASVDSRGRSDLKAATVYTKELLSWAAEELPDETAKDWDKWRQQKLSDVQFNKFTSIPRLGEILSRFPKGTLFVEANPEDTSFGIGQRASNFLKRLAEPNTTIESAMKGLGENVQGWALVHAAKKLRDSGGLPVEEVSEDSDADAEPVPQVPKEGPEGLVTAGLYGGVAATVKSGALSFQGPALWALVGWLAVQCYVLH